MFIDNFKTKSLSAIIVICGILFGCGKEVTREIIVEKPGGLPDLNGTVDGGGGNGANGRPLESYIVNISDLPIFKSHLLGKIEILKTKFPLLVADFIHLLKERSWYIIPVDLNKNPSLGILPPWKIGTYFTTDQMAIQNLREVWIDDIKFEPMIDQDKSMLILHELIMGVRLLKHTAPLDRCLATAARELLKINKSDDGELSEKQQGELQQLNYQARRKQCMDEFRFSLPKTDAKIELTKEDYANIRKLTSMIFSSVDEIDTEELGLWFKNTQFRDYPEPAAEKK